MPGMYFEELKVGDEFLSPGRTITETDVVIFSCLTGDYNEIHTNVEFAQKIPSCERLVQGLLGLGISHGLMFRLGILDGTGVAFLGLEDWRFKAPLFIGDTVKARVRVFEKRLSKSRSGCGIVRFYVQLLKSGETVVQEGTKVIMMRCRDEMVQ